MSFGYSMKTAASNQASRRPILSGAMKEPLPSKHKSPISSLGSKPQDKGTNSSRNQHANSLASIGNTPKSSSYPSPSTYTYSGRMSPRTLRRTNELGVDKHRQTTPAVLPSESPVGDKYSSNNIRSNSSTMHTRQASSSSLGYLPELDTIASNYRLMTAAIRGQGSVTSPIHSSKDSCLPLKSSTSPPTLNESTSTRKNNINFNNSVLSTPPPTTTLNDCKGITEHSLGMHEHQSSLHTASGHVHQDQSPVRSTTSSSSFIVPTDVDVQSKSFTKPFISSTEPVLVGLRNLGNTDSKHMKREEERKMDLKLQHQAELNALQESLYRIEREQRRLEQERQEAEQQHQLEINALQEENEDLRDCLESRPWVVERDEVTLTNEKLGGGAYGKVRVAIFRGTRVAAKCLHQLIVSDYNRGMFTREMEISSRIHHPNIVQFIGATRVNNPILLYELMASSLHSKLQEGQPLTRPQIKDACCDITSALCYLHLWKPDPIIHRDVSSPNVLMEPLANGRWRSKLSDFGSANLQLHVKTIIPGNPAYSSPEARDPEYHSPAMDIYSLGVLITEMVLCRTPEMDDSKRHRRALSIAWQPMKAVVLRCIDSDRSQRPTSLQLLREIRSVK